MALNILRGSLLSAKELLELSKEKRAAVKGSLESRKQNTGSPPKIYGTNLVKKIYENLCVRAIPVGF